MRFQLIHSTAQVLRVAILFVSACPLSVAAGNGTLVPASYLGGLPDGASLTGSVTDSNGNVLVVGTISGANDAKDAFVAKFTPDGRTVLYLKVLSGKSVDAGGPIAVDRAGNAYLAGSTNSPDFPTTPGAYKSAAEGITAGFVAKLNPLGQVIYNTLYYPGADQSNSARDIAVDSGGDVFLTGQSVGHYFTTTPGAHAPSNPLNVFFVLRLSADGSRVIYSAGGGFGGVRIAVDAQSNAYALGSTLISDGREVPVTASAYQKTFTFTICSGGRAFGFPCAHQHVTKLSPTGQLVFCTFLTGTIQDTPSGIAVDANGDIYVAGTTSSTDYPITPDALQKENRVVLPPTFPREFFFFGFSLPQPRTGYLSKLSTDGSRLLYSTYLGGTRIDGINDMRWMEQGDLALLTTLQSPDFPSLPSAPPRCLPARTRDMPAVVRFDPVALTIRNTALITGLAPEESTILASNPASDATVLTSDGSFLVRAGGVRLTVVDPITCIFDAADQTQVSRVSPGQLVTMLGSGIGPETALTYDGSKAQLPLSLGGASVLVNGVAAPLMYAAKDQINFVIPYEVAEQKTAVIKVITPSGPTSERTVLVVERNPKISTDELTDFPVCNGMTPSESIAAAVLNEDLTRNSCQNPAKPGSRVLFFLNGTGVNHPGSTGANPGGGVPLELVVTEANGRPIEKVVSVPWAPLGVWEVTTRVSPDPQGFNLFGFAVNGVRLKTLDGIAVWVAP